MEECARLPLPTEDAAVGPDERAAQDNTRRGRRRRGERFAGIKHKKKVTKTLRGVC